MRASLVEVAIVTQTRTDHFKFSTSILNRLGEELNPNPDQGIIELVRNSYDADAITCNIELINVDKPGGSIRVRDNGLGMGFDDITRGWLVLGKSSKSQLKRTPLLKRRPVGDKGLGRLAALRMGSRVSLVTRPADEPLFQHSVIIDWERYATATVVEDVTLELRTDQPPEGLGKGTEICIQDLRFAFGEKEVQRLARALLLLADPFDNPTGFRPILDASQFRTLQKTLKHRYFEDADFHLEAELDIQGHAHATVYDWKGERRWSADHATLRKSGKEQKYGCPSAKFDLWAYILDKRTFVGRSSSVQDIQKWLKSVGGVHFYHRGLRAYPYGDGGHDWLEMNLRRVQSPELRPSTNTSIGRLSVEDPDNLLRAKTDRTGFIEDTCFEELRSFAQDALEWMATCRLREREEKRTSERVKAPRVVKTARTTLDQVIKEMPKDSQGKLKGAVELYEKAREREASTLRKEVQLYRTLSTVGTTFAVFAHEVQSPFARIKNTALAIERKGKEKLGSQYQKELGHRVDLIARTADALIAFPRLALQLLDKDKRRTEILPLHATVTEIVDLFAPFLDESEVKAKMEFVDSEPRVLCTVAAIHSIVVNLLTNALNAFSYDRHPSRKRRVVFRTEMAPKVVTLRVLDSGPGIQGLSVDEIWLPGKTTVPNGTGLGLTIVRDAVSDLGGTVWAVANGDLGGAEIVIELPLQKEAQ
jgi:signal transduction histidine kinase